MLSDSLADWLSDSLADSDCESDVDAECECLLAVEPLGSQDSDGAEPDRLVDSLSDWLADSLLAESLCESLEVDSESDCELSLVDDSDLDDSLAEDWLEAEPDEDDSDAVDPLNEIESLFELIDSLLLDCEAELSDDVLLALDDDDLLESDDLLEIDD